MRSSVPDKVNRIISLCIFIAYLIVCLAFAAGINVTINFLWENSQDLNTNTSSIFPTLFNNTWEIVEVIVLALHICILFSKKKQAIFYILLVFIIVLLILKLLTQFVNEIYLSNDGMMIAMSVLRIIVLYFSFLLNILNKSSLKKLFHRNFVENNFYGKFFKEKLNYQINKPIQTNNENLKNLNNSNVKVFQILSPSSPRKRQSGNVDDQQLSLILVEKVKIPKILNDDINTIDENLIENNNSHNPILTSTIDDLLSIYEMKNPIINEKYANMISELNRIPDVNFDVFKLSQFSEGNELVMLMCHLMFICNFHESLEINKKNYKNYFYLVNKTYRTNSYHNSIHGCDVTQTLYFIFKTCNIEICCNLSPLELFSCYFASSIHDLDHPGNNNNYEIATGSTLAISYNDKAVLENYHLCKAFSLLRKPECDIYENFSRSNYNTSRAIIINMVLSTDMANHFLDLNLTKSRIKSDDFNAEGVDKQLMLNELIHSADISNPMKPMDIYNQWIKRVFIEFYDQGDKERQQGLKISYLCDRYTVNIIDSQIGFIDNIVLPLYNSLADAFPNMKMFVNLINNNKSDLIALKQKGQNITLD